MALDEAAHRLFVATRSPARMVVFDAGNSKLLAALPCVQPTISITIRGANAYTSRVERATSVFSGKMIPTFTSFLLRFHQL